ncbi:MAG: glucosaminidase domain-containing protein [Acidobacteria bacterium]|nr:glucosaminidase domain-containing protein [Acidobacteriota bacterium]
MTDYQANFLRRLVPAVLAWQQRAGLPASVVLAQAILESDWGRSALARRNRNLFGIKAHARGDGAALYTTTEYAAGRARRVRARFAHYPSYDACLDAYARLLARPRYQRARAVAANPFAFAAELQRCGYSTDPRYARKLTLLIRRYQLTQYDSPAEASTKAGLSRPVVTNEDLPAADLHST